MTRLATPSPDAVPSPTPTAAATQGATDTVAQTRLLLNDIPIVDGRSEARYYRDAFGETWYDVDGNGCRTRDDILGRDLTNPTFKPGTNECGVKSGVLTDPYSGVVVDFVSGWDTSQLVPVDHIVALAWAWRQGADDWTAAQRLKFANDPINLVATTREMNDEKLDHGPSQWAPPLQASRCDYVVRWVTVLGVYELGVNAADKAAAESVLDQC
nr:hypothetical protein GCM10025699_02220 [Microbacterium flavescens]